MTQGGKQKITGLWKRTGRLHEKIFKGLASADANGLVELLTECQSIAIDVGCVKGRGSAGACAGGIL